jgi:hypothetical protein
MCTEDEEVGDMGFRNALEGRVRYEQGKLRLKMSLPLRNTRYI